MRVLNDSLESVPNWSLPVRETLRKRAAVRFEARVRVHVKYMYEGS